MFSLEKPPLVGEVAVSKKTPDSYEGMVSREELTTLALAQAAKDRAEEERILAELFQETEKGSSFEESDRLQEAIALIGRVDYQALRSIFDEMRARSGLQGESHFCDLEKISIDANMTGGAFNLQKGITLGTLPLSPKEGERISRSAFCRMMLSTLIHEEAHASSMNTEEQLTLGQRLWKTAQSFVRKTDPHVLSGYQRNQFERGQPTPEFMDLNEGVTDKIAEEVYGEYVRRTGDRRLFSDAQSPATYQVQSYLGSRALVTALVEVVAESVDIPSEKVWEAFKQGYFMGLDLQETKLRQSFEEIFSEGFIDRVAEYGSGEQGTAHEELLQTARQITLTDEARTRIRSDFDKYQVAVAERTAFTRGRKSKK